MSVDTVVKNHDAWDITITASGGKIDLQLKDLWHYKDLLTLFVKKDIVTVYKQTILGPIWFLIQPLFTTLIYVVIFGGVAKIGTDGIPPVLFYLGSVTLWNYFSETLSITSKTFTENASVFGKVYFPRIILPLSKVISGLVKFLIQFSLFIAVWLFYWLGKGTLTPNWHILLFPVLLATMGILSLGFGILITSMTTKYRDLAFLVAFGVQLLMYATPVIYPISKIKDHQLLLWLNPLSSLFETFKYAFIGKGTLSYFWLSYSILFSLFTLLIGIIVFNKVEKRFMDTV